MKVRALLVLYGAAMTFAGCVSPSTSSVTTPAAPDLTGNWQIQSDVNTGTAPPAGIVLFGALQSAGSQVNGTFRFANLGQPSQCGLDQFVTVTGSVDSGNNLALASSTMPNGTMVKIALGITGSRQPYSGAGTIEVDGPTCTFASKGAAGDQVANATGTFNGTLAPGTLVSPGTGPSATVSLALTQLENPQSDGQFPATGSINYTIGSCTGSASLTGTVSGVGVILSVTGSTTANPQVVGFVGTANPAATAVTAGFLEFAPAPCSTDPASSAIYYGTLNRQ